MPMLTFPSWLRRRWPTQRTTVAPTWLSTDLRDGNQALVNPMSNQTNWNSSAIEVAYPSASELEFQFVRSIIENGEVPDDVSLQIITPARPDLIARSIASLAGTKHAIIHLYNAVSPVFREVVFRNSKEQTVDLTLNAVRLVKKLTEEETARSGPGGLGKSFPDDKVMFNLAATVECAPSNHYADMVEYFGNNINQRNSVILSIHPHNDRGTAVGAAELGLLAGGDRIEGCLLGNGERTGNVDLITLALNLYSQGVSPRLDFSNLSEIVALVCRCNEVAVPVRYPYAGQLVFSAFAGTHQDAIKKGLDAQAQRWEKADRTGEGLKYWAVPYIPLDPKDLGFGYENLIRVSSQSGKAGTAYVIKQTMMLDLPRRMQVAFYKVIQDKSERLGTEMTAALITGSFKSTYCLDSKPVGRLHLHSYRLYPLSPSTREPSSPVSDYSDDLLILTPPVEDQSTLRFEGEISVDGTRRTIRGDGRGPVLAVIEALRADLSLDLSLGEFAAQTLNADNPSQSKAVTFMEALHSNTAPSKSGAGSIWGVGISSDVTTSKCRAVISAANGLIGDRELPRARMVFSPRPALPQGESWLHEVKLRAGHVTLRTPEIERPDILKAEAST
ncbi:hypothetical protein BD779DRAFT_1469324 [Infundibulicybe gibba]|nr:hypothetical protein BD779DRAFT_1469324 [Infundibulicybe gibba]